MFFIPTCLVCASVVGIGTGVLILSIRVPVLLTNRGVSKAKNRSAVISDIGVGVLLVIIDAALLAGIAIASAWLFSGD